MAATRQAVPITASRAQMQATRSVLTNAAQTSADEQRLVSQPPQPFQNPEGIVHLPAPVNRNAGHPFGEPAPKLSGTRWGGQKVREHSLTSGTDTPDDHMRAVGYEPGDTTSKNPIISGYPTRNNPRIVGGGNQQSARGRGKR